MCESYPTIRVGRLAQARQNNGGSEDTWPFRVANVHEATKIAKKLVGTKTAKLFEEAFVAAVENELQGKDYNWIEPDGVDYEVDGEFDPRPRREILADAKGTPGPIQLRPVHLSPQAAIVDFQEKALRLGEWEIVFCCCVTVCVNREFFSQKVRAERDTYSKLWSRAVLVRKSGKRAVNVTQEEVSEFLELARGLCEAAASSLAAEYEKVFNSVLLKPGETVEANGLHISLASTIESASVGTDEPDFEELFMFLREGGEFDQAHENACAQYLVQLGHSLSIFAAANNANAKLTVVRYDEDPEEYCGIFLCLETEMKVQFFGLAHLPLWLEPQQSKRVIHGERRWVQPSNHVSGKIIRKIARHY